MPPAHLTSTGIILLAVIAIAYGGTFLIRVVTGDVPANELQRSYFRAGHAHAGVLVILGLVIRLAIADTGVPTWSDTLSGGVLFAAILMPAGFFLSVAERNPSRPNAWRILIWIGAAILTIGLASAGIGLIVAGAALE